MGKLVRVQVLETEEFEEAFPPLDITDFNKWLSEIVSKIPQEHIHTARIEFSGVNNYGTSIGIVNVYYYRPKTPEEIMREQLCAEWAKNKEKEDRRKAFEALKKEFGE